MAIQQRMRVLFEDVFPEGAFVVGEVGAGRGLRADPGGEGGRSGAGGCADPGQGDREAGLAGPGGRR